jgi:5-methylcytosine-specific restriction endonuclease McrA
MASYICTPELKEQKRVFALEHGIKPPTLYGPANGNWKGGPRKCIDCGKELKFFKATRCKSCAKKGSLNPYHQKCLLEKSKNHRELLRAIRNTFKYRQWRSDVYTRDGFACQKCGVESNKLEAHHIKSIVAILRKHEIATVEQAIACDKLWDINNGQTLCEKCHSSTENYKGRNHSLLKQQDSKN